MSRHALDEVLARLSAEEMVSALGLGAAPRPVRSVAGAGFRAVSVPLARLLRRFDERIDAVGVSGAASAALDELGATLRPEGPAPPSSGPLVVVSNHPGAYDTLALFAAVARDDVAIVASDRVFLRALPALSRHLLFVPDGPGAGPLERARGLRRALARLRAGGAIVHFGAGRIEADPAFPPPPGQELLASWPQGTGALVRGAARAGGSVVAALVAGVHSARAKRSIFTRLAERRGVTTVAALLQIAFRRYRDVSTTVRFSAAASARALTQGSGPGVEADARITAAVRERLRALLPPA